MIMMTGNVKHVVHTSRTHYLLMAWIRIARLQVNYYQYICHHLISYSGIPGTVHNVPLSTSKDELIWISVVVNWSIFPNCYTLERRKFLGLSYNRRETRYKRPLGRDRPGAGVTAHGCSPWIHGHERQHTRKMLLVPMELWAANKKALHYCSSELNFRAESRTPADN